MSTIDGVYSLFRLHCHMPHCSFFSSLEISSHGFKMFWWSPLLMGNSGTSPWNHCKTKASPPDRLSICGWPAPVGYRCPNHPDPAWEDSTAWRQPLGIRKYCWLLLFVFVCLLWFLLLLCSCSCLNSKKQCSKSREFRMGKQNGCCETKFWDPFSARMIWPKWRPKPVFCRGGLKRHSIWIVLCTSLH